MKVSTKELSRVNGTVANSITSHLTEFIDKFNDEDVSLTEYIDFVIDGICEANDTNYRSRIISIVKRKTTKLDALSYLYNVILSGDGMSVI